MYEDLFTILGDGNVSNEIDFNEDEIGELYESAINQFRQDIGTVNVLVTGKTGVGKSTLINSIFNENIAEVDIGRPVTQEITEYRRPDSPVSIIDTKGLEVEDYKRIITELEEYILRARSNLDISEHIHVAWVCVAESSSRFEPAERTLINLLLTYRIPVIVVLTKAIFNSEFEMKIKNECPFLNVIRVRAEKFIFDGGQELKPMNLLELVRLTNGVLEEGVRNALITSQKVSFQLKVDLAFKSINKYMEKVKGGRMYIPFNDAKYIVSTEIKMLTEITKIFNIELRKEFFKEIIINILDGKNMISNHITLNILKFIPLVNMKAKKITSKQASESVQRVGRIYINVLIKSMAHAYKTRNHEVPTESEILISLQNEKENMNNRVYSKNQLKNKASNYIFKAI